MKNGVKGGIVLAFFEKTALGSVSCLGAQRIARKPALRLPTQPCLKALLRDEEYTVVNGDVVPMHSGERGRFKLVRTARHSERG